MNSERKQAVLMCAVMVIASAVTSCGGFSAKQSISPSSLLFLGQDPVGQSALVSSPAEHSGGDNVVPGRSTAANEL